MSELLNCKRLKENRFEFKNHAKIEMKSEITVGRRGGRYKAYKYQIEFFYRGNYIVLQSPQKYRRFRDMKASAINAFKTRDNQTKLQQLKVN